MHFTRLLLTVFLSGVAPLALHAQEATDGSTAPDTQQPAPAAAPDASVTQDQAQTPPSDTDQQPVVRRVLIIGDQMAGGMGAGLGRAAQDDDTVQVVNRFNEASGLARPELYDWAAAIPKMTEGKNFAAAFVLIGINDRRDIRDNGNVLKFGTPEWDAVYGARVDAVMDALKAQNITVFWMGEPPVGEPALDADLQNLTELQKAHATAKGATFIDLRQPFLSAEGGYTERGPDETGADRRLRESDGITFLKQGNNRLGQIAFAALKGVAVPALPAPDAATPAAIQTTPDASAPVAVQPAPDAAAPVAQQPVPDQVQPQQQASLPQTVPPASAPQAAPVPSPDEQEPIFGQEGVDATTAAQGSKDIAAAVESEKAAQQAASASTIGIAAAKGSAAEKLFTVGLASPAPAGRFDDFSAPAQ
jgi:hypothetical protein